MPKPVIDGPRWIAERLAFLRQKLGENPPDAERLAIETEIEALSKERGIMSRGRRWLRPRRRPR